MVSKTKLIITGFIYCIFVAILCRDNSVASYDKPLILYVATNGNDQNLGTIDKPFASLEKARDTIRSIRAANKIPDSGVVVVIRGGYYYLSNTFYLNENDSGNSRAPVIYCQYKDEDVHIIGGKEVSGFKVVDDPLILRRLDPSVRGKVYQVDLKSIGITDYGDIAVRGFNKGGLSSGIELYFQGKPMTLARWPNHGWSQIIAAKTDGFTYSGDRPRRWLNADDVWLHGYWFWDWADSYVKIRTINTGAREIISSEPHGVFGYKQGQRYYAFNILEELDEPKEWYIDRKSGILYFLPPEELDRTKIYVSLLKTIISLNNVSYVTFRGISIEGCRGTAITVDDGSHNLIVACNIFNAGNDAIRFDKGTQNGVVGCDIYQCGEKGIKLGGGNRKSLEPGRNYAINNQIYNFSRWVRTYQSGIELSGVGNIVSHNLIHNAPHMAIWLHGNEHLIEFNEIHSVCTETSDAGAFYMGRDFSERGNILRYNYFHDIDRENVNAIYLDDFASATTIYGNIVYKIDKGVVIGGGRDNLVQNNMFIGCKTGIWIDGRGLVSGPNKYFNGSDTTLTDKLLSVRYKEPPYSTKYPELLTLYDKNPAVPEGNIILNNIVYDGKGIDLKYGATDKIVRIEGNIFGGDPKFVDLKKNNYLLRSDSPAFTYGFKQIPFDKIGLFIDENRRSVPLLQ